MSAMTIKSGEWVVVCDGARAIVLENVGDDKFPNLKSRETYEQENKPTHELGTDAPGRSFSSAGVNRSAVSQTDWHDQAEHAFLESIAKRMEQALTAGKAKSFILVAPPRALGMIRPAFSHGLKKAIRHEVAKDLVKLPVYEIEKHLTA